MRSRLPRQFGLMMVPRVLGHPVVRKSFLYGLEKGNEVEGESMFSTFLTISVALVLLGGIFAGLTLGFMGQDEVYLKVMESSGNSSEKYHAGRVLKLLNRGKHWVLVTLLLSNVITNETLPIVLDRCLGGGWQAVVISTVLIVIFGEIIPQSVCVRYGLQVGSLFCPFVLFLMYAMYPIAYPIALLLDWILGEDHGTIYKKSGLKTLVHLHRTMGIERLTLDEVTIISAVLDLKEKQVCKIMTPIDAVFTLSADKILDERTVEDIFNSGFSRIPIYLPGQPTNFIGMLLVRVLISYDPDDSLPVSHFPLATLPETAPTTSCLNILNYFQEGKSHMCVVSKDPGSSSGAMGLVTLEDVIEELIGEEIVDESDVFIDIHQRIMRDQPGPLSKRHITSYLHSLYTRRPLPEEQPLLSTQNRSRVNGGSGQNNFNLATNLHPVNLASNPIVVDKPFVTIKRQNYGEMTGAGNSILNVQDVPEPERNVAKINSFENINNNIEEERTSKTTRASTPSPLPISFQPIESKDVPSVAIIKASDEPSHVNSIHHSNDSYDRLITTIIPNDKKEHQTVISSSYKSTKNGIVESVITVKGVSKTIIEPASDWDDSKNLDSNEFHNIEESSGNDHRSSTNSSTDSDHPRNFFNKDPSRRGSRLSINPFKSSSSHTIPIQSSDVNI